MRLTLRTTALTGLLALGALAIAALPADAGCGGGGGSRGGAWGGHTFGRAAYGGYSAGRSGCGSGCGMAMPGMSMPMQVGGSAPAAQGANDAPAGSYVCPMHPNVVSATPAGCPYCGMALRRR